METFWKLKKYFLFKGKLNVNNYFCLANKIQIYYYIIIIILVLLHL